MVVRYKRAFDLGKTVRKPTDLGFRRKDHQKSAFPGNPPKPGSRLSTGKKLPATTPELQSDRDVN